MILLLLVWTHCSVCSYQLHAGVHCGKGEIIYSPFMGAFLGILSKLCTQYSRWPLSHSSSSNRSIFVSVCVSDEAHKHLSERSWFCLYRRFLTSLYWHILPSPNLSKVPSCWLSIVPSYCLLVAFHLSLRPSFLIISLGGCCSSNQPRLPCFILPQSILIIKMIGSFAQLFHKALREHSFILMGTYEY